MDRIKILNELMHYGDIDYLETLSDERLEVIYKTLFKEE